MIMILCETCGWVNNNDKWKNRSEYSRIFLLILMKEIDTEGIDINFDIECYNTNDKDTEDEEVKDVDENIGNNCELNAS